MSVSPHPSVRPEKPHDPPSDRKGRGESGQSGVSYGAKGEFHGYEHSKEHTDGHYGHDHKMKVHGTGDHKSEFEGAHSFPKAGE